MHRWLVVGCVFAGFALYASARSPVPGVNEPHYLCKAKHFVDPDWCRRDLFLQSADVHAVFFATIGPLTRFLTLEQTAWVGRIAAWLCLAIGWRALASVLIPGRWGALWGATATLAAWSLASFSGEWVVGGVESKVFAYGCLFFALAAACRADWLRLAAALGIAISFHPVVGGWGLISLLFSAVAVTISQRRKHSAAGVPQSSASAPETDLPGDPPASTRELETDSPGDSPLDPETAAARSAGIALPDRRTCISAGLLLIVCSLPGLVPAIALLRNAPSAEVAHQADEIQVFGRLKHHLDPQRFSTAAYVIYVELLLVWLWLLYRKPRTTAQQVFDYFVGGTILIALAGLVIGFGPRTAGLLKFYPFRLFDAFLPLAVAVEAVRYITAFRPQRWGWVLAAVCLGVSLGVPVSDRNPTGWKAQRRSDWKQACGWIAANTPADSLFLTPKYNFGFKWSAGRAEYVAYKDCPQDAVSLVEWRRRLDWIHHWRTSHFPPLHPAGFDSAAVAELVRQTEIDYVLAWRMESIDPYRQKPVYANDTFAVYRVR